MRKLQLAFAFAICATAAQTASAQIMITESFKVSLDCHTDACKKQMENSLYTKGGVRNAEWDVETKTLTVTYDPKKVSSEDVRKKVDATTTETAVADVRGVKK
jgi:periplasmic mercuric ion binding protein